MVWSRDRSDEHQKRSQAFSGLLGQTGRRAAAEGRRGSRGGAPIWVMHGEGFGLMPSAKRSRKRGRLGAREGQTSPPYRQVLAGSHEGPRGIPHVSDEQAEADPDGFAVFGRFPKGWLAHALNLRILGDVRRDDILHVCSGTLGPSEKWTVDLRPQARPLVVADGKALPFRADSFRAILIDPPYSDSYARNLYGVENPRPSWLLGEAARVVMPGGRIGLMHVGIPFAPPACFLVRVWPVSTGVGFRGRWVTVYERESERLL